MILTVVKYGNPILRAKGEEITRFDEELKQLSIDMIDTMHAHGGVGITAHQVGKPLQLFAIDPNMKSEDADFFYELDGKKQPLELIMPLVAVNPTIMNLSEIFKGLEEECLSFPDISGVVKRCTEIRMNYQDIEGNHHVLYATGLLAGIVQHMYDHLYGKLFIDVMDANDIIKHKSKIEELEKGLAG